MRVIEREPRAFDRDAALFREQPPDCLDAFDQSFALGRRIDSEHVGVAGERARSAAQNYPAAGDLIEHRVAIGDMERMMVRDADHARPQHYPARARRRRSDENVRRGDYLPSGGMMLTDKSLVVTQMVKPFDQLKIALIGKCRILSGRVKRGKKDSEFHLKS